MQAEKQELTILFCDLLGSTELAERLPLDDFLAMMKSYHQCLYEGITIHYGYVAQHLGDGIMAYFGYPVRFELAPVQAIKSGLSLVEKMEVFRAEMLLRYQVDLRIRVSIHTGIVVMADLGLGNRRERLAIGGPPNVASRLQSVAPENGIVVSEATYRQAADHFRFASLGKHAFKGVTDMMEVYQPLAAVTQV